MALGNYVVGSNTDDTLIHKGRVVSVPDDPTGFKPIKCRLQVVDSMIYNDNDLSDCYSLLPKHLNVYPKVGEYVYVLTLNKSNFQQIRYYLGPVIDTFKNLTYNPDDNIETNAPIRVDLRQEPEKGIYPSRSQISIQGRNNSDLVLKDQEVLIRAGKFIANQPLKFNNVDTAYIQLRYGEPELKETKQTQTIREVKKINPEGFILADLTNIIGANFNWIVNIRVEDKNNNFIGRIYNTFGTKDEAIVFLKTTFINLQKNDVATKMLILDSLGKNIVNDQYDLSIYKYIINNQGATPELNGFDVNRLTETVITSKTVPVTETVFNSSKGSAINVVGNKINLVSYGNIKNFKLLDPELTITAEQQLKINTEAQPVPYGYILNDFLGLLKKFVSSHVHNYHGLPPDPDPIVTDIVNFNLDDILNLNVRTA